MCRPPVLEYCYDIIILAIQLHGKKLAVLQNVQDNSLLNQYYRVVEFFNTIQHIYCNELLHAGYKKTFEKELLLATYSYVCSCRCL